MAATGFFQTSGGSILELDIPAEDTHARERFDDKLSRGELEPVPAGEVEQVVVAVDTVPAVGGGFIEVPTYQWHRKTVDEPATATEPEPAPEAAEPPTVAVDSGEVPDGSIAAVLDWVGDDTDRARLALVTEEAAPHPRSTLVAELRDLIGE